MKTSLLFISVLILCSCATLFNKQTSSPVIEITKVDSTVVENTIDTNITENIAVTKTDSIIDIKENTVEIFSPIVDDSLHLVRFATNFKAKQLNLTNSILENPELNVLLSKKDISSFKTNSNFDYFITMIVLKQFEFHITKYHQGFDLFTMKAGNAGFIVSSFVELSHLPEGTKSVNSSYILEYIANNQSLKNDSSISEIINRISSLSN
jgi:hypothetical protein